MVDQLKQAWLLRASIEADAQLVIWTYILWGTVRGLERGDLQPLNAPLSYLRSVAARQTA